MNYSDEEITRQLQLAEDSRWEFKAVEFAGNRPKSPSREDLADEIAAFANADGGVLLCGVTDDGEVLGMSREQIVALDSLLVEVSTDSIKPAVRIRTYHRQLDGRPFILVEIPEGDSQHDSPGGSYVRVGGTKRSMTSDERLRLAQRRGQARFLWFDKQTVSGTGFGTLDEVLWKPLLSAEGLVDPELALEKMGLLAPDENGTTRATVAGVLLCSNTPEQWLPNACITATCYLGADRASGQLDSQTIGGPINKQITHALAFAVRNMGIAARKEPARQDLPQYSENALFEALVNAVVHRDYSIRGSRIRLSMFEGRLELCSPGPLPNNLTIESMGERQSTRNEVLTSVLGRMSVEGIEGAGGRQFFMERRGDGVRIIKRATLELSGSLPEFRLVDESELCLTIPAAPLNPWDLFRGGFAKDPAATAVITVRCGDQPLAAVEVLAIFPNKTWQRTTTDENGEASIDLHLHVAHRPITVFAASIGYTAQLERDWKPAQRPLALDLTPLPGGGSVIFPEATGNIPSLTGRLNPIRDNLDRTYLYASNIAINQGKSQPVHFTFGDDLRLTDADGREAMLRIVNVVGRSALLEYRLVTKV